MTFLPPEFTAISTPLSLRLRDIVSFQLPRLAAGSSAPPSNSAAASAPSQLESHEAELNDALQQCRDLVDKGDILIDELLDDLSLDPNKLDVVVDAEWSRLRQQYADARASARQTILTARRSHAELKKQGRLRAAAAADDTPNDAAISVKQSRGQTSAGSDRARGRVSATGDDAALHASSNLTNALKITLSRMSDSLVQSSYSSKLLEESMSTLETLSLDYTTFADLLRNSGSILKGMERSDRIDALMLLGAYAFFVACVGYILKVRIWDRGVGVIMIVLRILGLQSGKTSGAKAATTASATVAKAALNKSPSSLADTAQAVEATAQAIFDGLSKAVKKQPPADVTSSPSLESAVEEASPAIAVDQPLPSLADVVEDLLLKTPSSREEQYREAPMSHDEL